VDAVKGDLTHDAVLKSAQELKNRTDKEAKNLRDILASVKPAKKLDAKEALEMFQDICDDGHLVACLVQLPDIFTELPETEQRDSYSAFARCLERIDNEHGELVDAWTREDSEAKKPITVTAAGQPVGRLRFATRSIRQALPRRGWRARQNEQRTRGARREFQGVEGEHTGDSPAGTDGGDVRSRIQQQRENISAER